MGMSQQTTETGMSVVGKLATGAQYGGAAGAVGSGLDTILGLTASEWSVVGVIGGLAIGAIGFIVNACVNVYFKRQHLLIAQKKAQVDLDE